MSLDAVLDVPAGARSDRSAAAAVACAHCGAPAADGAAFCCSGCAAAFAFIRELGLERYYRSRTLNPAERLPRPPDDAAGEAAQYAIAAGDGTCTLSLLIDGLHCAACVWLIEQALQRDAAVISSRVNLTSRRLALRWQGGAEAADRPGARPHFRPGRGPHPARQGG